MLFEAHGRQNKSSNDESYVGSEGRFSERAASQYTESPAAPISAMAFFAVFPRSSKEQRRSAAEEAATTCSDVGSVLAPPRDPPPGAQNSTGLGAPLPYRAPGPVRRLGGPPAG